MSPFTPYVRGLTALADFYTSNLSLLRSLPPQLRCPSQLSQQLAQNEDFEVVAPLHTVQTYNERIEQLKSYIRELHATSSQPPNMMANIAMMVVLRLACVVAAGVYGSAAATLALSLLQFAVLPYSLFASVTMLITLTPPLFLGHILALGFWTVLCNVFLPLPESLALYLHLPINNTTILLFFLWDQWGCLAVQRKTPLGKTATRDTATLLQHALYGFFNTKTYTLVILLLCRGNTIAVLPWVFDALFGLASQLADSISAVTMHWALLFYHEHRIVHLPRVYEQVNFLSLSLSLSLSLFSFSCFGSSALSHSSPR